ncbi:MAG: hypothetical protein VKK63_01115 [Synechococcus sp.]|nr:hypothetical protein [Synechococcus sp.]
MGDRNGSANPGGGSALSVLAGAVIGAAGLAWWLLSEAERRRLDGSQARALRMARPVGDVARNGTTRNETVSNDRDLHDRVHELNQAIDDVRRQLETMNTQT